MNKDEYPATSGHLVVKCVGEDSFAVKDMLTKKIGYANESLKDLLLLCDGTRTTKDILASLSQLYGENTEEIERKMNKSLKYLEGLGLISMGGQPKPSSIAFYNRRLRWPLNLVYIEATNRCNLSCIHCYAQANKTKNEELATSQMLKLIDQLSELEVMEIVLTGGEPLLRGDIFEIMEHATRKNMNVHLFTNGTLLDEEKAKRLKQLNVETVAVSLDGATPETHNIIRGSNCFDTVLNNIRLLTKMGVHTRVNTAFYKDNLPELEKLVELLTDAGVHEIQIDYLMPYGRGTACKDLILPLEKGEEIAFRYHKKLSEVERKERVRVPELRMDDSTSVESIAPKRKSLCGVGTNTCAIRPNGDVVLCPVLSSDEFVAGNALKESLENVWLSSEVFSSLRNHNADDIEKCRECAEKDHCRGGCKAKAYVFHGRFDAPDPLMCQHYAGYERWKKSTAQ